MAGGGHMPSQQARRHPEEDIFGIVGGVELEASSHHQHHSNQAQHPNSASTTSLYQGNRMQQANNASTNSLESAAAAESNRGSFGNLSLLGENIAEEQPSRILFIRGLDGSVSDEALVQMFEVYRKSAELSTQQHAVSHALTTINILGTLHICLQCTRYPPCI